MKKILTVFEGCARTPCILQLLRFWTPRTICRTCILHDWEEAEQLQQVSGKEEQHSHLQSSHFMHHVGTIQYRKNPQASKQAEVQACYMTHPEILKHTISREDKSVCYGRVSKNCSERGDKICERSETRCGTKTRRQIAKQRTRPRFLMAEILLTEEMQEVPPCLNSFRRVSEHGAGVVGHGS